MVDSNGIIGINLKATSNDKTKKTAKPNKKFFLFRRTIDKIEISRFEYTVDVWTLERA